MNVIELFAGADPNWREWLMGWPIKWTALEPLGTAKSQPFTNWLSAFFMGG